MEYNDNAYQTRMDGVVEGVYYMQQERVDELNHRIFARNLASAPLQPNYNPRPVPTKYSRFPIIDRRAPIKESLNTYPEYNVSSNFYAGDGRAPINGIMNNIEVETLLRNQYFALQKGADHAIYVPDSTSDLYNVTLPENTQRREPQPHPDLFEHYQLDTRTHPNVTNMPYVGNAQFFNHTRTQLRGGEQ